MATIVIDDDTVTGGGTAPDAPTDLITESEWDGVRLHWTLPPQRDVDYIEIWRSTTNDRSTATLVAEIKACCYVDHSLETGTRYYWVRARSNTGLTSDYEPLSSTGGVSGIPEAVADVGSATQGQLLAYDGSQWANTGTVTSASSLRFRRAVSGATGSAYALLLSRQATGAARVSNNGPHIGFEYQGTDNTEATSPIVAVRGLYSSDGENYLEILRLAGSYTTGVQTIGRLKRGDYFLKNTTGYSSFIHNDSTTTLTGQSATSGYFNILFLNKRRTDVTAPVDGDKGDFRIGFQGNTGNAISVGKFEGTYDATNGHSFSMNVYEATGATSIPTVSTTQEETTISAIPSGGGAPADVATFNRDSVSFLPPVAFPTLSSTSIAALSPSAGWTVFNTTTSKLQCYDGSAWQDLF